MKRREANFSVVFRHWLRANPMRTTCAFEVKQTTKDTISFGCVEDHQLTYLEAIGVSPKGVLTRVQGTNGEPDYIYLYRDAVFIVIKFPKFFCLIYLAEFMDEKESSKRKSLTEKRARQIAWQTVDL